DDSFPGVPDLFDAALVQFKVSVRPEYQREGRRFPCDETVPLRVWCVHGRQEHGLRVAALPTLGLRFYYYDPESLRNLVAHYVQQSLEGVTPQALSRYLPPAAVTLEEVVVSVRNREPKSRRWEPELLTLQAVAEPLGDPRVRKQFARPWERDAAVADLVRRLGQERANVLLVGESGAGKTTVLVEAVRQLERTAEDGGEPRRGKSARRYWLT